MPDNNAVQEEVKNEKLKIYQDVASGNSQNMMQLLKDLYSYKAGGPTTLMVAAQMIYAGVEEYIDATIYHTNEVTIENLKEALAEPSPEETVRYLQDWLKQYEERYEVIPREAMGGNDEKQE